jgi:tetratricopeptide (TPR) repeat protein
VYPDERVARFVSENFIPARVQVREQAADFQRLGERYGAQWTPTILELDADGTERHRVEGFLPAVDLLAQLTFGLGQMAFKRKDWKEAERRYREVADRYPRTETAAEAVYWAGVSRYKASNDPTALRDTERALIERYPESSWTKKASVWKG